MINSTRHALVFAMLSTASGWGLPSHDSLLSPNESGVDGPRDRRQLQLGSGSSCDSGCQYTSSSSCDSSCDSSCNSGCNAGCDFGGIFSCDDSCDRSCDSNCNSGCDSGGVPYNCDSGCDTCVPGVSCPADYAGTPPYGSTCYSDGHLEVAYDPYNGIYYYPGCTKLGGCDESCNGGCDSSCDLGSWGSCDSSCDNSCDSNCDGASCMSGNTGTLKVTVTIVKELAVGHKMDGTLKATGTLKALAPATPSEKSTGTLKATPYEKSTEKRTVTIVKELAVGDTIEGLDADKQPALCTVEAVGMFGHGALYGNYTEDHFVLDPATGNVMQHGAVGKRTVEDKYEVLTSCPVGLDEAGTGFTPMDGDFCGKSTSEMSWSDYLLIHASMLRIVRATGGYWFSASAYSDFESVVKHGPELCAAMLACAGDDIECDELERISTLFVDNYLADDAREATLKWMPRSKGEVGAPGSVSFVVSQGKAPHRALVEPTKDTALLIATGAGGAGGPISGGKISGGPALGSKIP